MQPQDEEPTERSGLLSASDVNYNSHSQHRRIVGGHNGRSLTPSELETCSRSMMSSAGLTKEDDMLGDTAVGEILPYSPYSSIDFVHDMVKDAYRKRAITLRPGIKAYFICQLDALSGWIAVAVIGAVTGAIAWMIDVSEATISDYKFGYCTDNVLYSREECCRGVAEAGQCEAFVAWGNRFGTNFGVYLFWACMCGIISSSITMLSRMSLPVAADDLDSQYLSADSRSKLPQSLSQPKAVYMAAGAGIPEIKTILSGFVIPGFLGAKVLFLKVVGSVFAVASGLPLGKEAPLIHIGTCVANLVGERIPKYSTNGKQLRELLTAGSAAGISAAFGAPIGGVLFAYEELSVYFPRKALYRTFLCSIMAAIVLKSLDPFGTGRLVLFETKYGTSYTQWHYLAFVFIGCVGGIWGGTFTRLNKLWARWFRGFSMIRDHPVFEVFLVTLTVGCLQFVDPATRSRYDQIIRNLLVDCTAATEDSWVCQHESAPNNTHYILWLAYGTVQVLTTTTITAGTKLPSGIIMPALAGGALFGRLVGHPIALWTGTGISPGIFAMVGAGAFLAGVTRMTISLCVVMFELTGELEFVLPHMVAILCAKWTADAISRESIYDVVQTLLGHPFLSPDEAIAKISRHDADTAVALVPPAQTMQELTVAVPSSNKVPRTELAKRLAMLKKRGLLDSGLVLVQNDAIVQGYISQTELEFGLSTLAAAYPADAEVRLLGHATEDGELDFSRFVNRAPVCICAEAPMEIVVALFTQLGCRYVCLTEEGTGRLVGVVIRKRLMAYLDGVEH